MRNLKKILALVLALVMSLSLVTIAGASKFPDVEADNAYATAIDVVDALKVFIGFEDGTFQPKGDLTRAQAAVLIYRIATGDVDAKYVENYTDMTTKFNDLSGYNWAKGYINYCQNAGIIVGTSANTFSPGNKVTGYQLMVMVLRTLGYGKAGEFAAGSLNWELESASRCESLGMLKNIKNTGDFGAAATREMTAEILFRGLLQETVDYSIATPGGYTKTGETLGKKMFGLEEVEGVLVANEYADIRRDETTQKGNSTAESAGISVLRNSKGDYRVTVSSKLEDLGETHVVYTVPASTGVKNTYDLTGVALEKKYTGDTTEVVYDGGEKLTSSQFNTKSGNVEAKAQRYVNFGEEYLDDVKTSIKVTYEAKEIVEQISARTKAAAEEIFREKYYLDPDNSAGVNAELKKNDKGEDVSGTYIVTYTPADGDLIKFSDTSAAKDVKSDGKGHVFSITTARGNRTIEKGTPVYRVEIEPKAVYTSFDETMIKAIFYRASTTDNSETAGLMVSGAVYRGTQDRTDYSDDDSYETFVTNCLTTPTVYSNASVSTNEAGWWLKMVDNDKDGWVDYIFQTRYTVAKVTKVADDGKLTLDTWKSSTAIDSSSSVIDKVNRPTNDTAISGVINYDGGTIEVGDVVYYAKIDGKNYAWKCEEVYGRITNVNRTAKTITMADGTVYNESAVHEHSKSDTIFSGVDSITGTVEMTLYMDKYGNLAAYAQNHTGKLVLLTDGWARTLKDGNEYAVRAYDQESKGLEVYDVVTGGGLFVDTEGNNYWDYSSVNSWNRILPFYGINCIPENLYRVRHGAGTDNFYYEILEDAYYLGVYGGEERRADLAVDKDWAEEGEAGWEKWDDIHTIVAYMDDIEGTGARLVPVDKIYDVKGSNSHDYRMIDIKDNTLLYSSLVDGVIYHTDSANRTPYNNPYKNLAKNTDLDEVRVRALATTTYYFVYQNGSNWTNAANGLTVKSFTGYSAARSWADSNSVSAADYVEDVYAVGVKATDSKGDYYNAEVVVVELGNGFRPTAYDLDREDGFIYKVLDHDTDKRYDQLAVIHGDGSTTPIWVDEGEFDNGDAGLYELVPTTRTFAGETIYRIYPISADGGNNYVIGTVAVGYNDADYAVIDRWEVNGDDELVPTDGENKGVYNWKYRDVDKSKYFVVTVDDDGVADADGKDVEVEDVLYRETKKNEYNYVLIRYNSRNSTDQKYGEARISFALTFSGDDAIDLWEDLVP